MFQANVMTMDYGLSNYGLVAERSNNKFTISTRLFCAFPIAIGILLETGVPKAFGITVFKGKNKGKRSRPNSEVII